MSAARERFGWATPRYCSSLIDFAHPVADHRDMATASLPVDLARVDDAIRSLMRWLTDHQIPCTAQQLQALDDETKKQSRANATVFSCRRPWPPRC